MKTRNSKYTTSMDSSFTYESEHSVTTDSDSEYDTEKSELSNLSENELDLNNIISVKDDANLNKRGLPKRKTTLKLYNIIEEELCTEDEDDPDFDVNNFDKSLYYDNSEYEKIFKKGKSKPCKILKKWYCSSLEHACILWCSFRSQGPIYVDRILR